jgi:hypothetical protein
LKIVHRGMAAVPLTRRARQARRGRMSQMGRCSES